MCFCLARAHILDPSTGLVTGTGDEMGLQNVARRQFVFSGAVASAGALLVGTPLLARAAEKKAKEQTEVGPAEDLMREHGGLNRILLIYEEGIRRMQGKADFDPSSIHKSATIIRTFVEDYHEKLEEEFLFTRMRKIGKLTDLVDTLKAQHDAGRKLTLKIEKLATVSAIKVDADRELLLAAMQSFIRMYRPHESREDTILFPAFHESMTEKEYDKLGDQFEDREHKLFGKEGFEGVVVQISEIEKSLGIYDLSQFTPADK